MAVNPVWMVPSRYCFAGAAEGQKNSFFLANDSGLLDIMNQQGLQWATHLVPAVKDDRLGIDRTLLQFAERSLVRGGSVLDLCGECQYRTWQHSAHV
jgi:hypothetical protein